MADPKKASNNLFYFVLAILIVAVIGLCIVAIIRKPDSSTSITNATVVIAIAGAVAVGIERLIEAIWTLVSLTPNDQWPLNLATFKDKRNELETFFTNINSHINDLKKDTAIFNDFTTKCGSAVTDFQSSMASIKATDVSDPNFQQFSAKALQAVYALQSYDNEFSNLSNGFNSALDALSTFVDTFQDNPGRKLISILLGMALGLVVAIFTGLNLFQALLAPATPATNVLYWGVALTGITLGLGSSPTHEVIQLLTQFKQNQTSSNQSG
jgi:hypothetical protein